MHNRHPGTGHLMEMLKPNPNLPPRLLVPSQECQALAQTMLDHCEDGPELTAGLRKLLEAKDCFVRQALVDSRKSE